MRKSRAPLDATASSASASSIAQTARWTQTYRSGLPNSAGFGGFGTNFGLSVSKKGLNILKIGTGMSVVNHSPSWVNQYKYLLQGEIADLLRSSGGFQGRSSHRLGTYSLNRYGTPGATVRATRSVLLPQHINALSRARQSSDTRALVECAAELVQETIREMTRVVTYRERPTCLQEFKEADASGTMTFVSVEPNLMALMIGLSNLKDMFGTVIGVTKNALIMNTLIERFMLNHTLSPAATVPGGGGGNQTTNYSRLQLVGYYNQAHKDIQEYLQLLTLLNTWLLQGLEVIPDGGSRGAGYMPVQINPAGWIAGLVTFFPGSIERQETILKVLTTGLPGKMKAVSASLGKYYRLVDGLIRGENVVVVNENREDTAAAVSPAYDHQLVTGFDLMGPSMSSIMAPIMTPTMTATTNSTGMALGMDNTALDDDDDDDEGMEFVDLWPTPGMRLMTTGMGMGIDNLVQAGTKTAERRYSSPALQSIPSPFSSSGMSHQMAQMSGMSPPVSNSAFMTLPSSGLCNSFTSSSGAYNQLASSPFLDQTAMNSAATAATINSGMGMGMGTDMGMGMQVPIITAPSTPRPGTRNSSARGGQKAKRKSMDLRSMNGTQPFWNA